VRVSISNATSPNDQMSEAAVATMLRRPASKVAMTSGGA
jgi:hypothetical protein